jgi:hypothetical protein
MRVSVVDNQAFIVIIVRDRGVWPSPPPPLSCSFRASKPPLFLRSRALRLRSQSVAVCGQSSPWQIHFYFWLKMVANEDRAFSLSEMSWLLLQPFILYFMARPMNSFI